jgi:hypothetical protein
MIHCDRDVPRSNAPRWAGDGGFISVAKGVLVFGARNVPETTPEPFCRGARAFFSCFFWPVGAEILAVFRQYTSAGAYANTAAIHFGVDQVWGPRSALRGP